MSNIDREATVPEDQNAATVVVLPNGEFNTLRVYMLTLFAHVHVNCFYVVDVFIILEYPCQKTVFNLITSIFSRKKKFR